MWFHGSIHQRTDTLRVFAESRAAATVDNSTQARPHTLACAHTHSRKTPSTHLHQGLLLEGALVVFCRQLCQLQHVCAHECCVGTRACLCVCVCACVTRRERQCDHVGQRELIMVLNDQVTHSHARTHKLAQTRKTRVSIMDAHSLAGLPLCSSSCVPAEPRLWIL